MQKNAFLLYGANGYTGELIARHASQYGLYPVLAGRRQEAIEPLATRLGLPFLIIDLSDTAALQTALQQVTLVVHAAGPYNTTAKPMIEACMATGTHYIDLNGDATVFELLQTYDQQAKDRNLMLLPGAGFDVVPTDCLALWLKNRLPDATSLQIAFTIAGSSLSRGTAITTLQALGQPGATRKNGILVPEPVGARSLWVRFPGQNKPLFTMSIPWGDLSTAYFSTGIPNIETYTGISKTAWYLSKVQFLFNWLLRTPFVQWAAKSIINLLPAGPDDARRDKASSLIWAKATTPKGKSLIATMQCPEGYSLTAFTVLLIAQKILNGEFRPGYQTPASAYGEDLIMEIPGVSRSC
jgi:short subunit dehydrogenase-like uncharacterized protein